MISNTTFTGPADVSRYLLVEERVLAAVRQHPAVLTFPLAAALGGLLAATAVSQIPHASSPALLIVWIFTGLLVARLILAVASWSIYYIVLTKDRMLVLSGLFTRTVIVVRLTDLENLTFERSSTGRITGHGSMTIGPSGAPQAVIDFVPYPERLYLEIRQIINGTYRETYREDDPYEE
jgi:hypothetical protein